jgi:hypothetical protein
MPTPFEIQGAVRLRKLNALYLPRSLDTRLLLKLFPFFKDNSTKLIYERRGFVTGLQWARGEGGPTGPVRRPGIESFSVAPGRYGDYYDVTESELEDMRDVGSWNEFESDTAQVARGSEYLNTRFLDRAENSIAQMMMTGVISASNVAGTEMDRQVFNIPQYTPAILFDQLATAVPLNYIRKLIPKLMLGIAADFRKGFLLCSRPTLNLVMNNANPADFFGRRADYGATFNKLEDLNDFMASNDLPQFKTYDEGWYSDPVGNAKPVFNRFLTNGKVVLCGVRDDGEPIGEYRLTRAAANPGSAPGEWFSVEDRRNMEPFKVILRQGHNGGCVPYYPEAIACLNVAPSNSTEFN